jgi:hypothetical protein
VRTFAALVVGVGLVFGLTTVAAAATDGSGSAESVAISDARCAQVRRRLAGAPATLRRVDVNLEELRARVAAVRAPARRTLLEERIQRLEQLRASLAERVADARAACITVT